MDVTLPKINNLKVHIEVNNKCIDRIRKTLKLSGRKWKKSKEFHNFLVIKDKYSYIIFPESKNKKGKKKGGYINITGIKSFEDVENVIPELCVTFELNRIQVTGEVVIDNVTANGDFGQKLHLPRIQEVINGETEKDGNTFSASFDRNYFPGAFCKTFPKIGTILIFPSGKYVIVGSKCVAEVQKVYQMMLAVIQKL
jgi:TATA-box binding protein (TBP) (component of TFIID and TFIIIB)